MALIKLLIEYDGTEFSGWQWQREQRTVQGVLGGAVSCLLKEEVVLRASSRTDAGVHARGLPVVFETDRELPLKAYLHGLNSLLPKDVSVRHAERVSDEFSVRRPRGGKRYRYRIWNDASRSALEARYSWFVAPPLDLAAMRDAAGHLVGEHDFNAFRSAQCDAKTSVRCIDAIDVDRDGEFLVHIDVQGNAFLRNMVRIIAGTLVDVGLSRLTPDEVATILQSRERVKAGQTAPARGLFLEWVSYE